MVWQASLGSIVSKTFEPGGAINILIGLGAKRHLSRPHGSLNQNHSGLPSWVVLRSIKAPISRMFFQIQNHRRTQRHIFLGSGLIAHSQKITVAARAMAEKKVIGHLS